MALPVIGASVPMALVCDSTGGGYVHLLGVFL